MVTHYFHEIFMKQRIKQLRMRKGFNQNSFMPLDALSHHPEIIAPADRLRIRGVHVAILAVLPAAGLALHYLNHDKARNPSAISEDLSEPALSPALREPWQQMCLKNRHADKLAGRETDETLEAKLEAIVTRTMNQIMAKGMSMSVPPEISRALMREVVQHVQQFRNNPAFLSATPSGQDAMLGHLEHRMRKHALMRHTHLMRYHQAKDSHSLDGHEGLASLLGFGGHSDLMRDGEEWMTSLHHDSHLSHGR